MAPSRHGARQRDDTYATLAETEPDGELVYLRSAQGRSNVSDVVEARLRAIEVHASELAKTVASTRAILAVVERRLRELREVEQRVATLRADLDARERPARRQRVEQPCPLSSRELEVLVALADGMVYKQIAHELSLSVSTVRSHLHRAYAKLGVADRAQAVLLATKHGWI
jgi:DNA-binding NarL/FixJ family response regulator